MALFEKIFGEELFAQIRPVVEGPYEEFLRAAVEKAKSVSREAEEKYGIGEEVTWGFDQDTATLSLEFPKHTAEATAEVIGTYSFESQSWMWAWANSDVDATLTAASEKTREYGQSKGFDDLVNPHWEAAEGDAWMMAAAALYVAGGVGLYGGSFGPGRVMFLIKSFTSE